MATKLVVPTPTIREGRRLSKAMFKEGWLYVNKLESAARHYVSLIDGQMTYESQAEGPVELPLSPFAGACFVGLDTASNLWQFDIRDQGATVYTFGAETEAGAKGWVMVINKDILEHARTTIVLLRGMSKRSQGQAATKGEYALHRDEEFEERSIYLVIDAENISWYTSHTQETLLGSLPRSKITKVTAHTGATPGITINNTHTFLTSSQENADLWTALTQKYQSQETSTESEKFIQLNLREIDSDSETICVSSPADYQALTIEALQSRAARIFKLEGSTPILRVEGQELSNHGSLISEFLPKGGIVQVVSSVSMIPTKDSTQGIVPALLSPVCDENDSDVSSVYSTSDVVLREDELLALTTRIEDDKTASVDVKRLVEYMKRLSTTVLQLQEQFIAAHSENERYKAELTRLRGKVGNNTPSRKYFAEAKEWVAELMAIQQELDPDTAGNKAVSEPTLTSTETVPTILNTNGTEGVSKMSDIQDNDTNTDATEGARVDAKAAPIASGEEEDREKLSALLVYHQARMRESANEVTRLTSLLQLPVPDGSSLATPPRRTAPNPPGLVTRRLNGLQRARSLTAPCSNNAAP